MTAKEYNAGKLREATQGAYGARPRRVDVAWRDRALADLVSQKIAKSYAKPANCELWLVVFTTMHYLTEYVESGVLRVSEALRLARARLQGTTSAPFDEVWITNLRTRPVRIWPAAT